MFRMMNNLKNKKGFTLIELIVVLAVLAIIMAIAVPRFLGVQESARLDADKATIKSIEKLVELDFVKNGYNTARTYDNAAVQALITANIPETIDFKSTTYDGGENNISVTVTAVGKATATVAKP